MNSRCCILYNVNTTKYNGKFIQTICWYFLFKFKLEILFNIFKWIDLRNLWSQRRHHLFWVKIFDIIHFSNDGYHRRLFDKRYYDFDMHLSRLKIKRSLRKVPHLYVVLQTDIYSSIDRSSLRNVVYSQWTI